MNDTCNQIIAADSLVRKMAEEREELAEETSSTPLNSSFQLSQQRLIRPSRASQLTQVSLPQNNQGSSKRHIVSHFAADDGTLKESGTLDVVQKKQVEREELETMAVADEINSSTTLSSFQLIQSRLIRPSPSPSVPTINLRSTNQSSASHHLAPLSVYQDCAKHMESVRLIARGHMCRRRLFSKSIDLDEACTSAVPRAAKRARIEDYVDTFLLSEVAQKIRFSCHKQEVLHGGGLLVQSNLVRDNGNFDWPSADLQAMTTPTPTDCYSFMTGQQLLTNNKGHISRRALFQLDIKNQNQTCVMKDTSSQFSSCGWSLRGYDCDHDQTYRDHDSTIITNSSVALYDTNIKGCTPSTPPDSFQSFDTMVNLFQT